MCWGVSIGMFGHNPPRNPPQTNTASERPAVRFTLSNVDLIDL